MQILKQTEAVAVAEAEICFEEELEACHVIKVITHSHKWELKIV